MTDIIVVMSVKNWKNMTRNSLSWVKIESFTKPCKFILFSLITSNVYSAVTFLHIIYKCGMFRLDSEIEFHVPKVVDRLEILRVLLAGSLVSRNTDLMQIASVTHGFVAADLECMVAKAVMQASLTDQSSIDTSSLMWALSQVKPSAMREAVIQVPNVSNDP